MKRSLALLILVAGGVLALDMWTKQWAAATLAYHQPVEVLGQFVRLTYTRNSGVAFGLGAGTNFPYYLFSILAAVIILVMFLRRPAQSPTRKLSLSLILGGALGNLVDRLKSGEVVDFIEIGWNRWHWPVFNVADSAVTIGVVLFALTWARRVEGGSPQVAADRPGPAQGQPQLARRAPPDEEPNARSLGARTEHRGAAGSLPGGGSDGPLP